MKTSIQVLSQEEQEKVHEQTLDILENTGVKVVTDRGRKILAAAGARVNDDTKIVHFPKSLVEESLRLAPQEFTLGARRPDSDLKMNNGDCMLCPDGSGTMTMDSKTGERRPSTYQDWKNATRLFDALDEVGMYWNIVDHKEANRNYVDGAIDMFTNFSKHIQETTHSLEESSWLLEIMQVIFGSKEDIRRNHPVSCLLCPQSPLMIDKQYTDAYLALKGWNIPVAVMPMPLMGATAPANMISTVIQGNAEVLAMLCLLQAHEPGVPFIYALVLAAMEPRTGGLRNGSMESATMSVAVTEMARYYNLPVENSGGGTDAALPGIQSAYERAANFMPVTLSWPDVLIGLGLFGGSMVLRMEQILIDVEIFRLEKHVRRGIITSDDSWLTDVIKKVGPGGNYLCEQSTLTSIRSGEWYMPDFGVHDSYENWIAGGGKTLLDESREKVAHILETHEPLPFDENTEKELSRIKKKAAETN